MTPRPPRSTRTDTLFPYTTRFRSKLARDSGGSACRDVECVAVIASRLAPTVFRVVLRRCIRPKNLLEQSLLAIAAGQLAGVLDVPPGLRASRRGHDRKTQGRNSCTNSPLVCRSSPVKKKKTR